MSIDTQTLDALKHQLQEEKNRLEKELGRLATPTGVAGEYETKFEDIGSEEGDSVVETEAYVDNIAVESNLEQQLRDVNEALERMESGAYGRCLECGDEIDIERLRVYPAAKVCMKHHG